MAKYNGFGKKDKITEEDLIPLEETSRNGDKKKSAWHYLTHPWSNLAKFCLMAYVWVAVSMVYFGVSLGRILF